MHSKGRLGKSEVRWRNTFFERREKYYRKSRYAEKFKSSGLARKMQKSKDITVYGIKSKREEESQYWVAIWGEINKGGKIEELLVVHCIVGMSKRNVFSEWKSTQIEVQERWKLVENII